MNTAAQVPGAYTFVEQGTVNAGAGFVVAGTGPYSPIGSVAITWTQFSGAGEIVAGTGLSKSGNTLNNTGVLGLTAADASAVVAGTAQNPTVRTGSLDVIATQHATAASVPMAGQKFTGLANGSASGDSVAFGQLGSAAFQPSSAFDASGAAAAAQSAAEAASDPVGSATAAAAYFLRVFAV